MNTKQLLLEDAQRYIKQVFGDDPEQALIELVRVHRFLSRIEEAKGESE